MPFWLVKNNLKTVIPKIIAPSMDQLGKMIVERARELVPVDTGKLRDSIGYTYRQDTGQLQIYADMSYALAVEMGTRRQKAQPYLRPALDEASSLWMQVKSVQFQFRAESEGAIAAASSFTSSFNTSNVTSNVRIDVPAVGQSF